jgi:hypothetical protein
VAVVNSTADDANALSLGARIGVDGSEVVAGYLGPGLFGQQALIAIALAPAVVATRTNDVDLLIEVLSHIYGPEASTLAVKTKAPDVAEAEGVDFTAPFLLTDKWIVFGNAVGASAAAVIHIQA